MKRPIQAEEDIDLASPHHSDPENLGLVGKRARSGDIQEVMELSDEPEVAVHQAVDRLAEQHGSRWAVVDDGGAKCTYRELQERSRLLAGALARQMTSSIAHNHASDDQMAVDSDQADFGVLGVLMLRSCEWVAMTLASSRLRMPLLALSGDLNSPEEQQRNREALAEHVPKVLVAERALLHSVELPIPPQTQVIEWETLAAMIKQEPVVPTLPNDLTRSPDEVVYWVYTGGTTSASKCVAVTHRMVLHELKIYPEVSPIKETDRVLHQSSAYWGATALGLLDIPWCCGACLVLTKGTGKPQEVADAIEKYKITVIGVVPSVLEALDESACQSIRIVFTWGEALAPHVVARWAPRASLLDLLIATEYWLVLYADHRQAHAGFRPVPGAQLTLKSPDQTDSSASSEAVQEVGPGEVGELFLAGPMVSSVGYKSAALNAGVFVDLKIGPEGKSVRHFRTRDLARIKHDGSLEYCGRADGFAKVGGRWLDLAAIERKLLAAGSVQAALVWDEKAKERHAAVKITATSTDAAGASKQKSLAARAGDLRRLLPRDTKLHILSEMPMNPATGKINRRELIKWLSSATEGCKAHQASSEVVRMRFALAVGQQLATLAGVRGALQLPVTFAVAPGLVEVPGQSVGLVDSLPSGLAWLINSWVHWYRAAVRCLRSWELVALPFVMLLLLDNAGSGLSKFWNLAAAPARGTLPLAILMVRFSSPSTLTLLVAAGRAFARKRCGEGGKSFPWTFWLGFPQLAYNSFRFREPTTAKSEREARAVVTGILKEITKLEAKEYKSTAELPSLSRCAYCSAFYPDSNSGEWWQGKWYCTDCSVGWAEYNKRRQAEQRKKNEQQGSAPSTPAVTPRSTASVEGSCSGAASATEFAAAAAASGSAVSSASDASPPITPRSSAFESALPTPRSSAASLASSNWTRGTPAPPECSEIDFGDAEITAAATAAKLALSAGTYIPIAVMSAGAEATVAAAPAAAVSVTLSPVARLVERVTGIDTREAEASLASLESLKVIALVSALRRDLKLDVAPAEVTKCEDLQALEALCEAAKPISTDNDDDRGAATAKDPLAEGAIAPVPRKLSTIPRFWRAPVGWLLRLDEMPEELPMMIACRALVRRHAAFRALPPNGVGEELYDELCNDCACNIAVLQKFFGVLPPKEEDIDGGGGTHRLVHRAGRGLWEAWTQVKCLPPNGRGPAEDGSVQPEEMANFKFMHFAAPADLREESLNRARTRGFKFPGAIGVLILDGDGDEEMPPPGRVPLFPGAYLHIAVNHAVSDAASIVPMVTDLIGLHRAAREVLAKQPVLPEHYIQNSATSSAASAAASDSGLPKSSSAASLVSAASGSFQSMETGSSVPKEPNPSSVPGSSPSGAACSTSQGPDSKGQEAMANSQSSSSSSGSKLKHHIVEALAVAALEAAQLPKAPGLEVQEARLKGAILMEDMLATAQDFAHNACNPSRHGYDHYLRLCSGACQIMEVASVSLGIPADHLMLAIVGMGFAVMAGHDKVKLSFIAPIRDGRFDGQAVGNLGAVRHLTLYMGGGRSLGACALDLSTRLRQREWDLADILNDDGDRIFMNIRSLPIFEGAQAVIEPINTNFGPSKNVRNICEMFADQEHPRQWTLWMGIRHDWSGSALAQSVRDVLWGLATNPLKKCC
mmetsp:Transcript_64146/g.134875  ORF Transcript_64146/g.134875 Transcript_64146/m.134875 type:complete len:1656 (+) Transcript_64146:128-5095(+)